MFKKQRIEIMEKAVMLVFQLSLLNGVAYATERDLTSISFNSSGLIELTLGFIGVLASYWAVRKMIRIGNKS